MFEKFSGLYKINASTVLVIGIIITTFCVISMILSVLRNERVFTKDRLISGGFGLLCILIGSWWLTLL